MTQEFGIRTRGNETIRGQWSGEDSIEEVEVCLKDTENKGWMFIKKYSGRKEPETPYKLATIEIENRW